MSLTIGEANALATVLHRLNGDPDVVPGVSVSDDRLVEDVQLLATKVHKTLMVGPQIEPDRIRRSLAVLDQAWDGSTR